MDIPLDIAKILAFSSKEGLIQPNFDVTDELFRSLGDLVMGYVQEVTLRKSNKQSYWKIHNR